MSDEILAVRPPRPAHWQSNPSDAFMLQITHYDLVTSVAADAMHSRWDTKCMGPGWWCVYHPVPRPIALNYELPSSAPNLRRPLRSRSRCQKMLRTATCVARSKHTPLMATGGFGELQHRGQSVTRGRRQARCRSHRYRSALASTSSCSTRAYREIGQKVRARIAVTACLSKPIRSGVARATVYFER
jgi:hypothetical protein